MDEWIFSLLSGDEIVSGQFGIGMQIERGHIRPPAFEVISIDLITRKNGLLQGVCERAGRTNCILSNGIKSEGLSQ